MSSSSDDERPPPPYQAPSLPPPPSAFAGSLPPLRMMDPNNGDDAAKLPASITTGTSLLASLVKAKAMSEGSESSDDDDDDDASHGESQPPSDDEMRDDEDELEQLLLQQEASARADPSRAHDKDKAASTICEVCHEDTLNAKRALVCAQCHVRFHTTCFRQKYAKLITTNHAKKWFCPDCEPIKKMTSMPKAARKSAKGTNARPKGATTPTKAPSPAAATTHDAKYARLVDVALKAGKKFNAMLIEKSEEMLHMAQSLKGDVEGHFATTAHDDEATPSAVLLRKVLAGLSTLESALYTVQYQSVQTEVDFIKDVKFPPNLEMKTLEKEAKEAAKAKLKVKTGGGASRLYSSAQIAKLEEWYSKSSRPESSEIQAMYRIINAPQYADAELQPEGIAVKQIRIWFDNRRAKERLDYMRLKMKDEDTSNLDNEDIKKLRAAYIDEAKEVLEARVAKMRETSAGAMEIVEEAEQLALEPSTSATSPAAEHEAAPEVTKRKAPAPATKSKQRLRMDHVASVRKACRLAREQGLSEEEVKEIRAKAMQAARDRLFYNGKALGSHPLTKDEVTDLKFKLLKLVEEDAPAEACIDILELLLSVDIPAQVLVDTRLDRQLKLVAKSHQENKELVKLATKLSDTIQAVIAAADDPNAMPASVETTLSEMKDAAPTKIVRAKFNVAQLRLLEKAYNLNDAPDKDQLLKLRMKMNKVSGESSSDYKQLRCWFYKRKAAGHAPNALAEALAAGDVKPMDEDDSEGDELPMDDEKPPAPASTARKSKVQGRIFSDKQLQVLHAAYDASPRPEASVFDELQDQMNILSEDETSAITKRQLKNWFSNRRAKDQKGKDMLAVMDDDSVKTEMTPAKRTTDLAHMLLNPYEEDDAMTQDSDDEGKDHVNEPMTEAASPKRKRSIDETSPSKKPKQEA
ncbi:hypothetical protein SPRG_07821 [Saprolegnia parasitica CBS 223.65]|uniref:Uncharacterized protein n=1 Tax=Saprolegnia parasitica (strain CBS 223.65) TaxID=695850 RepID=A0A067CD52_SAPPC|nr:hypothetical protein SPRG_07821 [Saprolegnia parasitica CBS 223.65]KDO27110.1 hypothetical protein SPRG_07821 [Saprolegnia parasitica CBS 223.65]|eukprot:XP_012202203.1 hypothetical protein SPRG_07821 [Saprolegnia parasitica CBS 223.65]